MKRRTRSKGRKLLAFVLCMATIMSMFGQVSFATGQDSYTVGPCEHHMEHTADCGYAAAVEGHDCSHVHSADCGYDAATGEGCSHVHDESCGFVEAVEEQPCTYSCPICAVQSRIDSLPETAELEAMTAEKLAAMQTEIDALYDAIDTLTAEEAEQINTARLDTAAQWLNDYQAQAQPETEPGIQLSAGDATVNTSDYSKTLTLTVTGTGSLTLNASGFQWQRSETGADETWENIENNDSATLALTLALGAAPIGGYYRCVYTHTVADQPEVEYTSNSINATLENPVTGIYINPIGEDETDAGGNIVKHAGSDSNTGYSPAEPVQSLQKAIEAYNALLIDESVEHADSNTLTLYVLNPISITGDTGGGDSFWPEGLTLQRYMHNGYMFQVTGGTLTLTGLTLKEAVEGNDPDSTASSEPLFELSGGRLSANNTQIPSLAITDTSKYVEGNPAVTVSGQPSAPISVRLDGETEGQTIQLLQDANTEITDPSGYVTITSNNWKAAASNGVITATYDSGIEPGAVVYLDGVYGNDENDGSTAGLAVKTYARALELVKADGGTIFICTTPVSVGNGATISNVYTDADGNATEKNFTITRNSGFSGNLFTVVNNATVTFKGLNIDGGGKGTGIYGNNGANLTIENCTLKNNNNAVNTTGGCNLNMTDTLVTGNNGIGVLLNNNSGTAAATFTRCTITANGSDGIGTSLADAQTSPCNVTVRDCAITNNGRDGIYLRIVNLTLVGTGGGQQTTISGNTRYGVHATRFNGNTNTRYVYVNGNVEIVGKSAAIYLDAGREKTSQKTYLQLNGGSITGDVIVARDTRYPSTTQAAGVERVYWNGTSLNGKLSLTDGTPISFLKSPKDIYETTGQKFNLVLNAYYVAGTVVAEANGGTNQPKELTEEDAELFTATFTGSNAANLSVALLEGKLVVYDTSYIYVDPGAAYDAAQADHGHDGSSPGKAVKTMEEALTIAKDIYNNDGTVKKIAVIGTLTVSETTAWDGSLGSGRTIEVNPFGDLEILAVIANGAQLTVTNLNVDGLERLSTVFNTSGAVTMDQGAVIEDMTGIAVIVQSSGSFTMKGNSVIEGPTGRAAQVYGSFTMEGDSKITNMPVRSGGVITDAANGARITLKDNAKITKNGNTNNAAFLIYLNYRTTMTIQDNAEITNCSSTLGMIRVGDNATLVMSGGKITNNKATVDNYTDPMCGGVYLRGTLTMTGGEISGNQAPNYSVSPVYPMRILKGDVFLEGTTSKLNLSGSAKIGGPIYLNRSGIITVTEDLTAGQTFQLYPLESLVGQPVVNLSSGVDLSNTLSNFKLSTAENAVYRTDYTLSEGQEEHAILLSMAGGDVYLSGSGSDDKDGRTPQTAVKTFAKAKELVGENCQIIICGQINITGQEEWNLSDKTGVTVRRMQNYTGNMINVKSGGNLSLSNIEIDGFQDEQLLSCSPILVVTGGTATIGNNTTLRNNNSSAIYATSGTVYLSGGSITGCAATRASGSSSANGAVHLNGSNTKMYITGGTISGHTLRSGNVSNPGLAAGVAVTGGADLYIQGGALTQSASADWQTAVAVTGSGSTVTMTGGEISGARNVQAISSGRFILSGGAIRSTGSGGNYNVYVNGGRLDIQDEGKVQMDAATATGVYLASGYLNMTGGEIVNPNKRTGVRGLNVNGGTASLSGGKISGMTKNAVVVTGGSAVLNVSGTASITGNTDDNGNGGGGVYAIVGTVNIRGGSITNNTAKGNGGGVMSSGAVLNISGGEISGNTGAHGGGVYFNNAVRSLTMTGGSITNNTARHGGGLSMRSIYRATLSGGQISGNTATGSGSAEAPAGSGGGVLVNGGGSLYLNGADVTGNKAGHGGGVRLENGSSYLGSGSEISGNIASYGGGVSMGGSNTSATLSGASITGNRASYGGGVHLDSSAVLEAVYGTISGNSATELTQSTGVYVNTGDLQLRGAGADISDTIYLNNVNHPITLTYGMSGSRTYPVAVNIAASDENVYDIGDIVVQPSRINVMDAGQYLRYFTLLAESNMTLLSSNSNLILSRCFFVNGVSGSDESDGTSPDNAFLTIERALEALGETGGTIYICGEVQLARELTLGSGVTLRPYDGFGVGGGDAGDAYTGTLVTVNNGGSLDLNGASVLGSGDAATEPLFVVKSGGIISMTAGEIRDHGNLAVDIEDGGKLTLSGGAVTGCANGEDRAIQVGGELVLSDAPTITDGEVYLKEDKVITVDGNLNLPRMVTVDMENASQGAVFAKTDSSSIANSAKNQFRLAAGLSGLYRVSVSETNLVLSPKSKVYLDPTGGKDDNNGANPATAVQTLKRAYELLKDTGGAIYIMNTVEIDGTTTLTANSYSSGSDSVTAGDTVDIIRYVKPSAAVANYEAASHGGALFSVAEGGSLSLTGLNIDGHHAAVTAGQTQDITSAFTATAPLIETAGTLTMTGVTMDNSRSSAESGGAVSVTGSGSLSMTGGSIGDALDKNSMAIVHDGGSFTLLGEPSLQGGVYLAEDRYITSNADMTPAAAISITMETAESGDKVVDYGETGYTSSATELKKFTVTNLDAITSLYLTGNADQNALLLSGATHIYVNGQNGSDDNSGYTPAAAVKSLSVALEKAVAMQGANIYVVDQVEIDGSVDVYNATILRYEKPASSTVEGFDVESYATGVLVNVGNGGSLTLGENASLGVSTVSDGDGVRHVFDTNAVSVAAGGSLTLNDGSAVGDTSLAATGTLTVSGSLTAGVISLAEDAYVTEGENLSSAITLKPEKTEVGVLLVTGSSETTWENYALESSVELASNTALHLFDDDIYIAAKTQVAITLPTGLVEDGTAKEATASLTRLDENTAVENAGITITYYSDAQCQTALEGVPTKAGVYYVKAAFAGDSGSYLMPSEAGPEKFTILEQFTVTFMDGEDTVDTRKVVSGGTLAVSDFPEVPTKTGYNSAWEKTENIENITGDMTVNAVHTAIEYTITYELNGGALAEGEENPGKYTIESDTITLKNPTREGYTFAGWTGSNGNTAQTEVTIKQGSTGNKTYTANWEAVEYTITYELDGGTDPGNPKSYTIESDAITLTAPTRTGYTFTGWTWDGQDEPMKDVTIETGSTGNKEYTANWSLNRYTVTVNYYWLGADGTAIETTVRETKDALSELSYSPAEIEGYTYAGAYSIGSGEKQTGDSASIDSLLADTTINFYYKKDLSITVTGNSATRTYTGNEQTVSDFTVTAATGVEVTSLPEGLSVAYGKDGVNQPSASGTNVGEYPMTLAAADFSLTGDAAGNYNASFETVNGKLTINKAKITEAAVSDIAAPAATAKPDEDATVAEGVHYTVTSVTWEPNVSSFGYDTAYTVTVVLTADDNYMFADEDSITSATINDQDATVTSVSADGSTLTMTYTFPKTGRQQFTVTQGTVTGGDISFSKTTAYAGDTITVTVTPDTGYEYSSLTADVDGVTFTPSTDDPSEYTFTMPASNVTVGASFTTITYTISYEGMEGATVTTANPESYTVESEDITLNNPTRTGYTFTGWTGSNGNTAQTEVTIEKGSTGNKTYTANWSLDSYTISYNLGGGSLAEGEENPESYTVESEDITLNNPTRTGYTFVGWTGSNGEDAQTEVTIKQGSTGNKTYTANWKAVEYSITYNLGGGALAEGEENPESYTVESEDITLNNPTRTGYTFVGWTGSNGTDAQTEVTIEQGSTGNKTYTANWTADDNSYTVKHWTQNLNAGDEQNESNYTLANTDTLSGKTAAEVTPAVKSYTGFTAPSTQTVTIAADGSTVVNYYYTRNSYTLTLNKGMGIASVTGADTYQYGAAVSINAALSDGYQWDKWTGTNAPEGQASEFTMPAGNVTLTATATPIQYSIGYTLNGGTVTPANPTSYTVESDNITLTAPTRTGYTFTGWTGSNGEEPQTEVTIEQGTTGDLEYTANWKAVEYTISYELNGGALAEGEENPGKYTIESDTITLKNPTKEGYTFTGWTGSNGDTPQTEVTIEKGSTGNKSYTANWKAVEYTISYELDGGALAEGVTNPASYTVETETFTLNNPTREGYNFLGWTGSNGEDVQTTVTITKGSTGDLEYTANWQIKTYKVTLTPGTGYTLAAADGSSSPVDHGGSYRFTLTVDEAYNKSAPVVKVNGEPIQPGADGIYTISNITANKTVTVEGVERNRIDVTVTKVWDDAENQDGKRPESITVKLWSNAALDDDGNPTTLNSEGTLTQVAQYTIQPNTDGSWPDHTFEQLLEYTDDGKKIAYSVTEDEVADYTTEITGDAASGFTVTNKHTPETINIPVTKVWEDDNDRDGIRPEQITIRIHANGAELEESAATVKADENGDWSHTFENLPKYKDGQVITYTITEDTVEGYTPDIQRVDGDDITKGFTVTNSYTPGRTYVSVTKAWDDANNQDGIRPDEITVQLLADGQPVEGKTLTLSEAEGWTGSFTELYLNEGGKPIAYTVEEAAVPDGYSASVTGDATTGYTITNTHTPETIDIPVTKAWDDGSNQDGVRPESIILRIYADDVELTTLAATVKADENGSWSYTFRSLPKYQEGAVGQEIVYTITEDTVDGYTPNIQRVDETDVAKGFTVTNSHVPKTINITVTKVWNDGNDHDGIRPNEITVKLLADGADTGRSLTLNAGNNWQGAFTELDEYADGSRIVYTVAEVSVNGYTTEIAGDAATGFVITNHHTPTSGDTPSTGDDSNLVLYIVLAAASGCGIVILAVYTRRRKRKDA